MAISYKVYSTWISEFQVQPDLNANANTVAIQNIKLENEGWECDTSVVAIADPVDAVSPAAATDGPGENWTK